MKKNLFFLVFLFNFYALSAAVYTVGSDADYPSPNALYLADVLQDGDTVRIAAEEYIGTAALAVWMQNDLLLQGTGGRPHLIADGEYIWGKGIWVLVGDNITVENIEFSGAAVPDQNGAGIRLDGVGLTVENCHFHDNENGILTNNPQTGNIHITHTEFGGNGHGDGFSHNLYIGRTDTLTFLYNYTHHAQIGHLLKSRAKVNIIEYNRFSDEATGSSSRLIDLSNGGKAVIVGNVFMQGENAPNNNFIGFGKEGLTAGIPHELYCGNNTFVNERQGSCLFIDFADGTDAVYLLNNIFTGGGTLTGGSTETFVESNVIIEDTDDLFFVDAENYDYRLTAESPVIDSGLFVDLEQEDLLPEKMYVHPVGFTERVKVNGVVDAGAYEFGEVSGTSDLSGNTMQVFPNPTAGIFRIAGLQPSARVRVFDMQGREVKAVRNDNSFDISGSASGVYVVKIFEGEESFFTTKVFK